MFDYEVEWSQSNFDRPHRLSVNYLWEIPGPQDGFWSYVARRVALSGVTQGQSGASLHHLHRRRRATATAAPGRTGPNVGTGGP